MMYLFNVFFVFIVNIFCTYIIISLIIVNAVFNWHLVLVLFINLVSCILVLLYFSLVSAAFNFHYYVVHAFLYIFCKLVKNNIVLIGVVLVKRNKSLLRKLYYISSATTTSYVYHKKLYISTIKEEQLLQCT